MSQLNSAPEPDDIGAYAGWGSPEDVQAKPGADAQAPVSRRRFIFGKYYQGPGNALMVLYLPIAAITLYIELWIGVPPVPAWLSMIGVAIAFLVVARRINRKRRE